MSRQRRERASQAGRQAALSAAPGAECRLLGYSAHQQLGSLCTSEYGRARAWSVLCTLDARFGRHHWGDDRCLPRSWRARAVLDQAARRCARQGLQR